MPIKIDISLSSGGRFKPGSSRTLDDARITIGRDDDCTLTLEDTQKHVSRVHAEIEEEDGVYMMGTSSDSILRQAMVGKREFERLKESFS